MRKWLIDISNRHEIIFKTLLYAAFVASAVWMLPQQKKFRYIYEVNKPWAYNNLEAPFDFAVKKNNDSLEAERRERLKYAPFYLKKIPLSDEGILHKLDNAVAEVYGNDSTFNSSQRKQEITTQLKKVAQEIYKTGVVNVAEWKSFTPDNPLKLVEGNLYTDVNYSDFIEKITLDETSKKIAGRLNIVLNDTINRIIVNVISPNIVPDEELNKSSRTHLAEDVSLYSGLVERGDLIISRGEIITPQKLLVLDSFRELNLNYSSAQDGALIGKILLTGIAFLMLMLFLAQLRSDIFWDNRKMILIFTINVFTLLIYTWILKSNVVSHYVVPLCILAVVIRTFFDTRLALFNHIVIVIIAGSADPGGFDFVFTQIAAGMVTLFAIKNMRNRSQAFSAVAMVFATYMICYITLLLIHDGTLENFVWEDAGWILGNVLLTLFAYPLIYFLEKIFSVTSDISLAELIDSGNPLLRELSIKAPGTFQHSLQVANLAEAAIFKIGGNALLVRAGALYHDIGKMDMPRYFIENQSTHVNPHDELSFEESASIIISHVIKGIEKARMHNVPDLVIDFIRTHHGTTLVQYFYESFLKNYPDKIIDEEMFHYPGPKPFSKETAVLMMADSVEAASRSLKNYDTSSIENLVEKIIDNQIEQEQFVNCNITFRDISEIKKLFKKMLGSIYHVRVEYA